MRLSGKDAISSAGVDAKLAELVDSAPGWADTLNDLAVVLGEPTNPATNVITTLNNAKAITDLISFDATTPRAVNLNSINIFSPPINSFSYSILYRSFWLPTKFLLSF